MKSILEIGSLVVDLETYRITLDGRTQQIEPKLAAVLVFLYEHRNQVVKRELLVEAVWKGQVISDNAISRSISQVRKLLSQSNSPKPSIETIPRVGYRLLLPEFWEKSRLAEKTNSSTSSVTKKNSIKQNKKSFHANWLDGNSLKVIFFLAFSLALFGRYFYQLIEDDSAPNYFVQSSLTITPGPERLPKISPDGHWLAYSASSTNKHGQFLHLLNLKSGQSSQLTSIPSYFLDLAWSPDSNSIVYSQWKSSHDKSCSINLMSLQAAKDASHRFPLKDEKLLDCSDRSAVKLAWNEQGNKIYFTARESYDRPYSIQSYAINSKRIEQVTLAPQSGNLRGDYYISGSLSGRHLAIVRYLGTHKLQLQVYQTTNKKMVATRSLDSDITAMTWLGDQRLIISRENNLYLYDFLSGKEAFYYAIGKNSGGLTANADGQRVAFTVSESDINLIQYQLTQANQKFSNYTTVAQSSAIEVMPSFANNQSQYAFLSNRSGSFQIWISDGFDKVKQLSDSPVSLNYSPLNWSPDDKLILFQHDDEIFTINVETAKINRMIDREHKAANADWSYDGTSIFYSSEKSGEWQIWQFDMGDETHRQITTLGGYSAKQDSTNNLYVSRIHQDGLWKLSFDSQTNNYTEAELILKNYSGTNWLSWQLLDNKIYYFGSDNELADADKKFGIMRLNLDDLSTSMWFSFEQSHQRYFSISSDQLIVTKITREEGSIELLTATTP